MSLTDKKSSYSQNGENTENTDKSQENTVNSDFSVPDTKVGLSGDLPTNKPTYAQNVKTQYIPQDNYTNRNSGNYRDSGNRDSDNRDSDNRYRSQKPYYSRGNNNNQEFREKDNRDSTRRRNNFPNNS